MIEDAPTRDGGSTRRGIAAFLVGVVLLLSFVAALRISIPVPQDLSRFRSVAPQHGSVDPSIERDEKTGFLIAFLDARVERKDAEQYLSDSARDMYEGFGDVTEYMESRALYALWRYKVEERNQEDGVASFWVREEGYDRMASPFAGYIHETFEVRDTSRGFEIFLRDNAAVTAF